MHSGRKDPFRKLPLFLCRGPGLPSSSRLCPAFDERRHSERGLHHLPQWRAKPEVTGVLRYDDRRGWLDCEYLHLFFLPTSIVDASVHLAQHPSIYTSPSSGHPFTHSPHAQPGALHCPQGLAQQPIGLVRQRKE